MAAAAAEGEGQQPEHPRPSKRGEIGFQEGGGEHGGHRQAVEQLGDVVLLPPRHPADRDHHPAEPTSVSNISTSASTTTTTSTAAATSPSNDDHSSLNSVDKRIAILLFFKRRKNTTVLGVRLTSWLIFALHTFFLGATVALWAFSALQINGDSNSTQTYMIPVFLHVIFGFLTIAQLLFFERRVFCMRAERYMHLHPSEMLPTTTATHRHHLSRRSSRMGLAPWNRPSLPTYAAALAQSGVGTGDVEDHLIAISPPPAYGHTRGSRLLLSGFLSETLRAQVQQSHRMSQISARSERPVSYRSRDEEWEAICDADRARRLEATLATLERSQSSSSSSSSRRQTEQV